MANGRGAQRGGRQAGSHNYTDEEFLFLVNIVFFKAAVALVRDMDVPNFGIAGCEEWEEVAATVDSSIATYLSQKTAEDGSLPPFVSVLDGEELSPQPHWRGRTAKSLSEKFKRQVKKLTSHLVNKRQSGASTTDHWKSAEKIILRICVLVATGLRLVQSETLSIDVVDDPPECLNEDHDELVKMGNWVVTNQHLALFLPSELLTADQRQQLLGLDGDGLGAALAQHMKLYREAIMEHMAEDDEAVWDVPVAAAAATSPSPSPPASRSRSAPPSASPSPPPQVASPPSAAADSIRVQTAKRKRPATQADVIQEKKRAAVRGGTYRQRQNSELTNALVRAADRDPVASVAAALRDTSDMDHKLRLLGYMSVHGHPRTDQFMDSLLAEMAPSLVPEPGPSVAGAGSSGEFDEDDDRPGKDES